MLAVVPGDSYGHESGKAASPSLIDEIVREGEHACVAVKAFDAAYGTKFPKAATKITDDIDELLAFYDYPAEHWVHLRTANPSRPSPRYGTVPRSPEDLGRGRRAWPWRSSSSRQPRPAGARSTHPTSSRLSAPGPALSAVSWSNAIISKRFAHRSAGEGWVGARRVSVVAGARDLAGPSRDGPAGVATGVAVRGW